MPKVIISTSFVGALLISGNVVSASEGASVQQDTVALAKTAAVAKTVKIKTVIGGKTKSFKQSSVYKNKVVYVSLGDVVKALLKEGEFSLEGKTYKGGFSGREITGTIGKTTAKVNGKAFKLPGKVEKVKGENVLVPIQAIDKAFGTKSKYSSKSKTLSISLPSKTVVDGIHVKYGKHTYGSKNQKEYDAVMKVVQSSIDRYNNGDYEDTSAMRDYLDDYLAGDRWDGDRTNWDKKNLGLAAVHSKIRGLAEGGVSGAGIKKAYAVKVMAGIGAEGTELLEGSPRSAYDSLVRKVTDCDADAQAISVFYDNAGYNTAVLIGGNHADAYVEIEGNWYKTTYIGFDLITNPDKELEGMHFLAAPTHGEFD